MAWASGTYSIVWGMNYFSLPPTRKYIVWDKGAGFKARDFAECELAWCSWDGNAEIYQRDPLACRDYVCKEHPTQKPVDLMKWCIQKAPAFSTILDPFAGSCTTARAAKELGVQCICIEREERYCEIGARRLAQEVLPL
jgi:DNA modification methylase